MTIFIDADSFPSLARQKAASLANDYHLEIVLVANRELKPSPGVRSIEVNKGKDCADLYILSTIVQGDIVLTQDILLAKEVLKAGCCALNGYGLIFTEEKIEIYLIERSLSMALAAADSSYRSSAKNYAPRHAIIFGEALRQCIVIALRKRL